MFPLTSPRLCRILPGCILQRLIRIGHICPCPRHTSTPRSQNILQQGPSALLHSSVDIWPLLPIHLHQFLVAFAQHFKSFIYFVVIIYFLCVYCLYLYLHCVSTLCIYTVYQADIFHFPNILNSLFISSLQTPTCICSALLLRHFVFTSWCFNLH